VPGEGYIFIRFNAHVETVLSRKNSIIVVDRMPRRSRGRKKKWRKCNAEKDFNNCDIVQQTQKDLDKETTPRDY
jgi:hypothetical protein